MTDIATIRRRIGDRPKAQNDIMEGNGVDRVIDLQHGNVWDVIVRIGETEIPAANYTVDAEPGRITFNAPPDQAAAIRISYLYATYTDEEIQELIDEYGLDGATIAILEELTADTARFHDYSQGETSSKRSQVFDHLLKLLENYRAKATAAKRGSGLRIGKRLASRSSINRRPNFEGTQDLTRWP